MSLKSCDSFLFIHEFVGHVDKISRDRRSQAPDDADRAGSFVADVVGFTEEEVGHLTERVLFVLAHKEQNVLSQFAVIEVALGRGDSAAVVLCDSQWKSVSFIE